MWLTDRQARVACALWCQPRRVLCRAKHRRRRRQQPQRCRRTTAPQVGLLRPAAVDTRPLAWLTRPAGVQMTAWATGGVMPRTPRLLPRPAAATTPGPCLTAPAPTTAGRTHRAHATRPLHPRLKRPLLLTRLAHSRWATRCLCCCGARQACQADVLVYLWLHAWSLCTVQQ